MRAAEDDVARAGASIAAVGTGDAAYARDFKAERAIEFPLLVDDEGVSYRAVQAGRGTLGALFKPTVLARGARAVVRGARQGRTGPAQLRLGATHVIRPDGSVPFAWHNGDYADTPSPRMVLDALAEPG